MRAIRGGEIGLVFQEPMSSLSAFHTVGNQLIEAIRLHSTLSKRAARARAIELLAMVGIPRPAQRVDAYSFELSGGLRQRVMIALALAAEPRILIADEPTTALDVTTQAQILELIRRLQQERGLAVILITHDMGVIAEMADDVVVMYLGHEVEKGPVDAIFHAPRHPYTRCVAALDPQRAGRTAVAAGDDRGLDPASLCAPVRLPVPSALPRRDRRRVREDVPRRGRDRRTPRCGVPPLHGWCGSGGMTGHVSSRALPLPLREGAGEGRDHNASPNPLRKEGDMLPPCRSCR